MRLECWHEVIYDPPSTNLMYVVHSPEVTHQAADALPRLETNGLEQGLLDDGIPVLLI